MSRVGITVGELVRQDSYTLTHERLPWTTNAQRQMHFHVQARLVAEWRNDFRLLAKMAKIPPLPAIAVEVQTHLRLRVSRDCGSEAPAVKAACDGLVDAHVIADDTPAHLRSILYLAPILGDGPDRMTLTIKPVA